MTKISIITPVLNGENFIRYNIESILQLKVPHEHIIIDGGSTDHTLKILDEYPHLVILHQHEHTGMYGAIDMGFRVAKGDYIGWINCDDMMVSDGFKRMYEYAVFRNLDFVCSDGIYNYVHKGCKRKIKGTRFVKYLLRSGTFPFSQPSTIFKRVLYLKVGGLNYSYKIIGDMDLFWRFANLRESRFGYIKTISSIFLKHGESLGDKNTKLSKEERFASKIPPLNKFNLCFHRLVRILNI